MAAARNTDEIRVADVMTRKVYSLTPTQSLPLAETMMAQLHLRHIPVVDESYRVVGLVTHRDLLGAKISRLTPLSNDERTTLELSVPVSRVMRAPVWTIGPDALCISAARIMREHRFGCLPVVDDRDHRLVGIVTEADLLMLVTDSLSLEPRARPWTIGHVMTQAPVAVAPDTPLAEVRSIMSRYGVHHLPVVDNGKPVAMVCERDLAVAETIFRESALATPAAHVVRLLGGGRVHTVTPSAALDTVLRAMFRERFDAVLVVTEGDKRLIGIFTAIDACRILADGMTHAR